MRDGAGRVTAPFTHEQVTSLNNFQRSGAMHPFTCGRCRDADTEAMVANPVQRSDGTVDVADQLLAYDPRLLVATTHGWVCLTCDYSQDWAWEWMADGSWHRMISEFWARAQDPGTAIKQWCVGFMIDPIREQVLLTRKAKPAWMAGKLNGVGGKVEPGESPFQAMVREGREETGSEDHDWKPMVKLTAVTVEDRTGIITPRSGIVWFFRRFTTTAAIDEIIGADRANPFVPGEHLERHDIRQLGLPGPGRDTVVPNLLWLLPFAAHQADGYELVEITETWTTLREAVPT